MHFNPITGVIIFRTSSRYGIAGNALNWFHSYFSNRTQSVLINGTSSVPNVLTEGVPQGSVMGPLCFLMYTAPLEDIIETCGTSKMIYADDTQIYVSLPKCADRATVIAQIASCICKIKDWSLRNSLKLNLGKTEVLHLRSRNKSLTSLSVNVCDIPILSVPKARDLGVIVQDDLSMKTHINKMCKSAALGLHRIGKIRNCLDRSTTEKLVHAFIFSHLDNNNGLLIGVPESQLTGLQRLQNSAARLVTRKRKFEHITPILRSLHWLPIRDRIKFKVLTLVFKCLHGNAPAYLSELIKPYQPGRNLRSQSKNLLSEIRVKSKTFGDRAFEKMAPTLWNKLPQNIRDITDFDTFKSMLKTHLFD